MTGLSFEVITSHVDEDKVEESVLRKYRDGHIRADMYQIAEEVACAQASAKASAVLESLGSSADSSDAAGTSDPSFADGTSDLNENDDRIIVIGSDTVVVTEEEILEQMP